jgi:Mg-chelatase subunit ChlD
MLRSPGSLNAVRLQQYGVEPRPPHPPDPDRAFRPGGIIHTYQKFDPRNFPSPTAPPPDLASAAFEHMLRYGSTRRLTPEELARAVKLDISQIAGLGPSLDALIEMLEERKRKILGAYETESVLEQAQRAYRDQADDALKHAALAPPPPAPGKPKHPLADALIDGIREENIPALERAWYTSGDESGPLGRAILRLIERLGEKYQVEELAAEYEFTGREAMDVPRAIEIKAELEAIDRLLEQLREAMKNAQIAVIDMDELAQFASEADMQNLQNLAGQLEQYLREQAELQGLEESAGGEGYRLTPQAYRIFQSRLLTEIFSSLEASRSGRHSGPITGEGAVELPATKPYEFGDSAANMDIAATFTNAMIRRAAEGRDRSLETASLLPSDIEIHRTRNNPKAATCVLMDMSGSMRYEGQYINVKRMALALDGLIRREYPGDYLSFIEMYSFARPRSVSEVPSLMPKPVTVHSPVVRLRADMSRPDITEGMVPSHFTNIQHALQLARRLLSAQDTPNRQIILLTDGLPTAHFEGPELFLLYPPDPRTEEATMREAMACRREGITINIFLLPSWWQSSEDVGFAHNIAERTGGRVFFTAGKDVDRYVLWDYVNHRRKIIG